MLDAVALQEIGDPALFSTHFPPYTLVVAPGPSTQHAGVGLLLSLSLAARARSYHRSSTGRLIGVVLELSRGQRTLLVSAYMPSGLDHLVASSPLHNDADELYSTILKWSKDMQQVVVMGDLNETLFFFELFTGNLYHPQSKVTSQSKKPKQDTELILLHS